MDLDSCVRRLQAEGTAQNRKVYARHGVGENMYGVSFAALGILKKEIRQNDELARGLWATGNHDARVLALMIADPERTTVKQLNNWVGDCDNPVLAGLYAKFAAATRHAGGRTTTWRRSKRELTRCVGWSLLGAIAGSAEGIEDDFFLPPLEQIARTIHDQPSLVREVMNGALIAVGCRNETLRMKAMAAARRVGQVDVDHGETNCKTPNAAESIEKAWKRRRAKPARTKRASGRGA